MNNNKQTSSGISFVGLLALAFIVLKLTDFIDWSWLWVLSPIWILIALVVVIVVIAAIVAAIYKNHEKL